MKNAINNLVNKTSFPILAIVTVILAAIAERIRAFAVKEAPEGYEDAAGFHFGKAKSK